MTQGIDKFIVPIKYQSIKTNRSFGTTLEVNVNVAGVWHDVLDFQNEGVSEKERHCVIVK